MANIITRYVDRFPEVIVTGNSLTYKALDWAANEIERIAKSRSRVKTGNMRNGWTHERVNNQTRVVFNPVEYTIFHEYGTVFMEAQPMLQPAVEEVRPQLIRMVQKAWLG